MNDLEEQIGRDVFHALSCFGGGLLNFLLCPASGIKASVTKLNTSLFLGHGDLPLLITRQDSGLPHWSIIGNSRLPPDTQACEEVTAVLILPPCQSFQERRQHTLFQTHLHVLSESYRFQIRSWRQGHPSPPI